MPRPCRGLGLGLALKIEDGAGRAAEVALAAILQRLGCLDDAARAALGERAAAAGAQRRGRGRSGEIRPAALPAPLRGAAG